MDELQQLLAALGVSSFADGLVAIKNGDQLFAALKKESGKDTVADAVTELCARAARAPFALAVEQATGKTGDEAIGLIRAALVSHADLPKAQARVAELEQSTQEHSLNALFAKAKDEKKLTPAIETKVREAFAAKEITLKGAESWLANLTVIPALESKTPPSAAEPGSQTPVPAAELKHEGKTFKELKPRERAALNESNPELYAAMRAAAGL